MSSSRVLKFRAWHEGRGKWVHKEACHILGEMILFGGWMDGVSIEELNAIVVEQFTGLNDKTGREIYEGDIFRYVGGCPEQTMLFVVRWPGYELPDDIEVIGNVHEHPELLEGA